MLFKCETQQDLLSALTLHNSVPPSGKLTGVEHDTLQESESGKEYSCTFKRAHDLGLVFSSSACADGSIIVLCFSKMEGGERDGPAEYDGDAIMPGDEGFWVKGVVGTLANAISNEGELCVQKGRGMSGDRSLVMSFRRPAFGSIERDAGGRPCQKQAKFPRKQTSEGGAPCRKPTEKAPKAP